ncbi:hypothetical protein [Pedobacter cryophilus]|uniref:Lipoprotein n=1 Tax=Pedobacter cryophilus TaxID=2571271 RepID=A0A4U1C334_9SPHI|nr:hypothetical protein [Pedobacter cryophilus]TKC00236.1 hypothetical protein FA046_00725 [Pedobacter cryophilus]
MSIKLYISFLAFLLLACNQENDNSDSVCPTVLCATPTQFFKLKFIDKDKQTDLFFGTVAKYSLNDLKIYSSRFKRNIDFNVDSTTKSDKYILISTSVTDEFAIKLANTATDELKVETKFINQTCCDILQITQLKLNNSVLSFSNTSPTVILLQK